MGLGTRRTGPIQDVYGSVAVPLQSPIVATQTDPFVPKGAHVHVFGTFAGAVGDITITLQRLDPDGVTWHDVGGPRHVWTRNIPGAMSGIMPLSGYSFITEESYRLNFICGIGGVLMNLGILVTDHEVTERTVPILEEIITSITSAQATHDAAVIALGPQNMGSARSTQAAAVANGDAARMVTNLYGEPVGAAYEWASQANRDREIDPLDTRGVQDFAVNVTNLAAAGPFYVYLSMQNYQHLSIQTTLSDGTATDDIEVRFYATNTVNAAPATIAAADWGDVTNDIAGLVPITNAAGPVNRFDVDRAAGGPFSCEWFRIGYTRVAGAANDGDVYVHVKRWY